MIIVTGHAIESTLLQSIAINKVKLELNGVNEDLYIIALPETAGVKGVQMDCSLQIRQRKGRNMTYKYYE